MRSFLHRALISTRARPTQSRLPYPYLLRYLWFPAFTYEGAFVCTSCFGTLRFCTRVLRDATSTPVPVSVSPGEL